MKLSLAKIIYCPGASEPFSLTADYSDMVFGWQKPVTEPVRAVGTVSNTAGVLLLDGSAETTLHCCCDRCGTEFQRKHVIPMHAVLTAELQDEDCESEDLFELDGTDVDLDEVLATAFVLNMETKFLCREDCKGLCSKCGADLNQGPCSCKPDIDPRFAVLQQLLDKTE